MVSADVRHHVYLLTYLRLSVGALDNCSVKPTDVRLYNYIDTVLTLKVRPSSQLARRHLGDLGFNHSHPTHTHILLIPTVVLRRSCSFMHVFLSYVLSD